MTRPKVLSCGGGLDSFAMLLDSVRRSEKPDYVTFVDVADPNYFDPGEWPGTYQHLSEVVRPLCWREGIEFVWLGDVLNVRGHRSLFDWMAQRNQIPVAGPNRICTRIAKVERFERWLDQTFPDQEVEVWVGFEAGEEKRAAKDPNAGGKKRPRPGCAVRVNRFPLIEHGYCRCDCERLVRTLGYPVPRKSACVFCPYGTKGDWQRLAAELPEQFAKVVDLEARKPPTKKNGLKLSIMGYRKGKAKPLPEFVKGSYKPKITPCPVCGSPRRASKAAGCGYLSQEEMLP